MNHNNKFNLFVILFLISFHLDANEVGSINPSPKSDNLSLSYLKPLGEITNLINQGFHFKFDHQSEDLNQSTLSFYEQNHLTFLNNFTPSIGVDLFHFTGKVLKRQLFYIGPTIQLNYLKEEKSFNYIFNLGIGIGFEAISVVGQRKSDLASSVSSQIGIEKNFQERVIRTGIEFGSIFDREAPLHHVGIFITYGELY